MRSRWVASAAMITVAGLALAGCSGRSGDEGGDDNTLTLWHYESETSAMGVAWAEAIKVFEEETGAKVEFEEKASSRSGRPRARCSTPTRRPTSWSTTRATPRRACSPARACSPTRPMPVEEYGWDDKLAPALQTTAKLQRRRRHGLRRPGTASRTTASTSTCTTTRTPSRRRASRSRRPARSSRPRCTSSCEAGITPLAEAGLEYPLGQLWYQLALAEADRQFVNDYQLYENQVDWHGDELTYATETLLDWTEKGYISPDSSGHQGR